MTFMPSTLISFAVKEGDVVEMGQELCVVEAVKMQNVIRSHKGGTVVSKLHGEVGASLQADEQRLVESILEVEKDVMLVLYFNVLVLLFLSIHSNNLA